MLRELINSIDQKLKRKRMSVREAVIATKRLNVQLQTERKLEARGWTHILAQQHLGILDVMLCALTSWTPNETVSMGWRTMSEPLPDSSKESAAFHELCRGLVSGNGAWPPNDELVANDGVFTTSTCRPDHRAVTFEVRKEMRCCMSMKHKRSPQYQE